MKLDEIRQCYGGYWRYPIQDFHYLFNHYFPTEALSAELRAEFDILLRHYPSSQRVVAKLLATWKEEDYFLAENLVVGNGSSELIRLLNSLVTSATIPVPTFNEYVRIPEERRTFHNLREEDQFQLDFEELIQAIKRNQSEWVILCHPNNPIGNLVSREGIERLLQMGQMVLIDEAFIDFSLGHSMEDLVANYENLIIVTTCTKSMGIAGIRLGYVLTRNTYILEKLREMIPIWNVNALSERFIELFPKYRKDYQTSLVQTANDREGMFKELQKIPYLEPFPSHANFIFCKTSLSARSIAESLFETHGFLLKNGLNQQELKSDSYIRIGLKGKEENETLLQALRELVHNT